MFAVWRWQITIIAMADFEVTRDDLLRLRGLVGEVGLVKAAKRLKLSRDTLLRILAEQPIRRGSAALMREALGTTGASLAMAADDAGRSRGR